MSQPSKAAGRSFPVILGRNPVFYCILLLLIPASAMVASLFAMRTDWFPPRAGNTYIATVGYGSQLRNASCDVLIDGDSSALTGVVPEIITRETGLSACNIAEFGGMEQVNGRLILDEYLKHNARPKFLVFVYVPENLFPQEEWTSVSHFEALLYRMRNHPDGTLVRGLLAHPKELFSFWTLGMRLVGQAFFAPALSEALLRGRETSHGWLAVPGSVLSSCLPGALVRAPNADYIRALRTQYGVASTTVLVDVTPEPVCEQDYDFYASKLPGVIDNEQQKFPIELYNESGRLHLIRQGADLFTAQIARQIMARGDAAPTSK
jgi:hypothetical protein